MKISYEVEYLDEEKRKFEVPQYINLYISYKDYNFTFSLDFDYLFSDKGSLMGLFISKKNKNIYCNGESAYSSGFDSIAKEKILKKPSYTKVILNLERKMKDFLNEYPYSANHYNIFKTNISRKEIEEIMDTWQSIIKNIFSERNKYD